MANSPNLDISYLQAAQAQKEVTTNTALQILDTFAGISSITVVNGTNSLTEEVCQAGLLVLTGALTASATVVVPVTLGKRTQVLNLCTGAGVSVQPYGFTAVACPYNVFVSVWPGASSNDGAGQLLTFSSVAVTSSAQTLTTAQVASSIIEFTGALTANTVITVPAAVAQWTVYNGTTGAFTLTIEALGGTGVAIPASGRSVIYCDGTNVFFSVTASGSAGVTSITDSASATGALTFAGAGVSQSGNTFTFAGGANSESYVQWAYPAVNGTYSFSSPTYPMTLMVMSSLASGNLNVQLPTQPSAGSVLRIKQASAGSTLTILAPSGGEVIDNSTASVVLSGQHSCITLVAGQSTSSPGWNIISQF